MKISYGIKLVKGSKLLGVILVISLALLLATVVSAGWEKVEVCHVTNVPTEGDGHIISIADPAWEAHAAHGDKLLGELGVTVKSDTECHVSTALDAVDDEVTTPMDTPVVINLLLNDFYVNPVVVSVEEFPQYGILGIVDVGIFEYTPNAGFVGTDSFTYTITDTGGSSDTATVTITVGP